MSARGERTRAGILDVAERAGVSRQTVTRAMNDMPGISAETKRRVLDAASELRYRPSRFGRGLVSRGTKTLGLVVVDLTNGFWAELASCMLDEASARGWTVLIAESSHDARAAVGKLLEHVDGMIGLLEFSNLEIEELVGHTPLVLLDPARGGTEWPGIRFHFDDAMAEVADHLIERGRRRTVMLDWSHTGTWSARASSFARAMESRGLEPLIMRTDTMGEPVLASGRLAATQALESWPDLDALVCFNDPVAVGALKSVQSSGRRVPTDVSVVGVDGSSIGLIVSPELTTLRFDLREVSHSALEMLVDLVDKGDGEERAHTPLLVAPTLTVRASS